MGLYAENYQRLTSLFDLAHLHAGRYVSHCPGGLDLVVDVLEIHAYTYELRLSYRMQDPLTGQPDPSAHVRVYRDARQAEATHCYVGRSWQDVLGLHPSPRVLFGHRLRMNSFLNKWLEYLKAQDHGALVALSSEAPDEEALSCA